MNRNYPKWLETARTAAVIGGDLLMDYFGKVNAATIESKQKGDWVSEADRASEKAIVEYFKKETPQFDILTEEEGAVYSDTKSRCRWIIDPLDGTTNFLRGFPVWAVSIALEERTESDEKWGRIVIGVINCPPQNEEYWAVVDGGAFRNGSRLEISNDRPFSESLLATGFPFRTRELIPEYMDLFSEIMKNCADVRRPGAVAMDLCWLASGVFDGFWELDLAPWDIAAGSLIINEAGGYTGNFQGGDDFLTTGDIVAGKSEIFEKLTKLTQKYFPHSRNVDKSVI